MGDLISLPPRGAPTSADVSTGVHHPLVTTGTFVRHERLPGWLDSRPRDGWLAVATVVVALGVAFVGLARPKDAVALLLGAIVVGAAALRPYVGVLILVTLVPVTSGFASGFPVAHVRISEALIGAVAVTVLVTARRCDAVGFGAVDWALLAYGLGWAAFGAYDAMVLRETLTLDQWGTVIGQLQFFLIYRAVRTGVRTSAERRGATLAVVGTAAVVGLLALLQELHAPGVRSFIAHVTGGVTPGFAATGGRFRATGPFANWAALAGFLLPVVLVSLAVAISGLVRTYRRLLWAALAVCAIGLLVSLEQSAIACAVVGALVIVSRYDPTGRRLRWAVAAVAAGAVAASPLVVARLLHEVSRSAGTGRIWWVPQTLSFRWSIWTHQYLPAIWARPLLGYGVVTPSSIRWPYPESQYVSLLVEGGIPVLLLFAAVAAVAVRSTLSGSRTADPLGRALATGCAIALVSIVVMGFTWPFLSNGGTPQVLWPLLALAAAPTPVAAWRRRSRRLAVTVPRPVAPRTAALEPPPLGTQP